MVTAALVAGWSSTLLDTRALESDPTSSDDEAAARGAAAPTAAAPTNCGVALASR